MLSLKVSEGRGRGRDNKGVPLQLGRGGVRAKISDNGRGGGEED